MSWRISPALELGLFFASEEPSLACQGISQMSTIATLGNRHGGQLVHTSIAIAIEPFGITGHTGWVMGGLFFFSDFSLALYCCVFSFLFFFQSIFKAVSGTGLIPFWHLSYGKIGAGPGNGYTFGDTDRIPGSE